jgi:hypothetical protein
MDKAPCFRKLHETEELSALTNESDFRAKNEVLKAVLFGVVRKYQIPRTNSS